jgi:acetyltransferase-like isoleucine patch superfamily enzyme
VEYLPRVAEHGLPSRIALGLRELVAAPTLLVVRQLPGPLGQRLRQRYWGRRLAGLGKGVRIDEGVHFVNPEHISIGSRCWIATNAFIGAGPSSTQAREIVRRENADFGGAEGEVRLGDDVYLAPGTLVNGHGGVEVAANVSLGAGAKLYSSSHHYRGPGDAAGVPTAAAGLRREPTAQIGRQALLIGPVVIGPEAFVGSQAIVLPGVTVGAAAWLGAGAVAGRSLEAGRIYRAPDPVAVETDPAAPAARLDARPG